MHMNIMVCLHLIVYTNLHVSLFTPIYHCLHQSIFLPLHLYSEGLVNFILNRESMTVPTKPTFHMKTILVGVSCHHILGVVCACVRGRGRHAFEGGDVHIHGRT